jgi:hypothetical protein
VDDLADFRWLDRGVPKESPEVADVYAFGEIRPPRPDRVGEYYLANHLAGDTASGYTSWTTNRDIAIAAAEDACDSSRLSGQIIIFRVKIASLAHDRLYHGRDDEDEWLIEGTVEWVTISESEIEEEEGDDD